MKGKPLKLAVLNAFELLAKATNGASALIVAEEKENLKAPTRRIALGWIAGECDFTQLRNAAVRFPETAFFGTADASVEHRNGTTYLQNDRRCRTSWSIRAIPLELVRCWSKYEDATGLTVQPEHDEQQTRVQPVTEMPRPIEGRAQPVALPASPTAVPLTLPAFRPLADLTVNRKRAFLGNCAGEQSAYVTDGRVLFVKSACEPRFAQSKTVTVGGYGPAAPVREDQLQKVFDEAVRGATCEAEILGYVWGKDIGRSENEMFACIATGSGAVVVVDADKLSFIQQQTGGEGVRVMAKQPEKYPVVLTKASVPVAVCITLYVPEVTAVFKKMIAAASRSVARASA